MLAAALSVGGCAGVADVTGTATRDDILELRTDVTAVQTSVRQLKTQLDALNAQAEASRRDQSGETDKQTAAQTAALAQRVDALAQTLTGVTAKIDDLNTRLESARATTSPPTAAGTAVPSAGGVAVARPSPPAPAPPHPPATAPPPTPSSRPTTGSLSPQDIYQAAYLDFSKGSYPLAITGFREFIRRFPEDELADNAQYWIGESYFSLARGYTNAGQADRATQALGQAVQEFRKVVANYPRGDKVPTALYKEALALIELKQPQTAAQRLQYLVENFPQAEETPLARERLASLKER